MTVRVGPACTACGACLITCPTRALSPAPRLPTVDAGRCTDCLACVEVCPSDAIALAPDAHFPAGSLPWSPEVPRTGEKSRRAQSSVADPTRGSALDLGGRSPARMSS